MTTVPKDKIIRDVFLSMSIASDRALRNGKPVTEAMQDTREYREWKSICQLLGGVALINAENERGLQEGKLAVHMLLKNASRDMLIPRIPKEISTRTELTGVVEMFLYGKRTEVTNQEPVRMGDFFAIALLIADFTTATGIELEPEFPDDDQDEEEDSWDDDWDEDEDEEYEEDEPINTIPFHLIPRDRCYCVDKAVGTYLCGVCQEVVCGNDVKKHRVEIHG